MTSDPVVPKGDGALVRLRVSPSDVWKVRGISGRDKTEFVNGVGAERVREVLAPRPG